MMPRSLASYKTSELFNQRPYKHNMVKPSGISAARFLALRARGAVRRPYVRRSRQHVTFQRQSTREVWEAIAGVVWVPAKTVSSAITKSLLGRVKYPQVVLPGERSSNAETLRRLRAKAVASGLCYTCRARPVRGDSRYCAECFRRGRDYKSSIAYKKCLSCCTDIVSSDRAGLLCRPCQDKYNHGQASHRLSLVDAGLCYRCGNPAEPDRTQCAKHLRESAKREREARSKHAG